MAATWMTAPDLERALAEAGLRGPGDLLDLATGARPESVQRRVTLPIRGTGGAFFLKAYRYPRTRRSLRMLGRGSLGGSAPEIREFLGLAWLRRHGLPAVRPVAAAAVGRCGLLRGHALLTEWVDDAPDLAQRLTGPAAEDPAWRGPVFERLAAVTGRMHALGFLHRDLFARNVLVGPTGDLWLLDCRRWGRVRLRRGRAHDLDTLTTDLASHWTPAEAAAFHAAYEAASSS